MSLEYVNRHGDRYFILQGKTKTGKPKYFCSKRDHGIPIDRLPEDFEIYENPERGQVYVRKIRPTRILPFEREMLASLARELSATAVIIDLDGDSLVAYASNVDPAAAERILAMLLGEPPTGRRAESDWLTRHAHYSPMFRFTLVDEDERLYSTDRWCYLGGIDSWVTLAAGGPLEAVGRYYLPHLGDESFFELM